MGGRERRDAAKKELKVQAGRMQKKREEEKELEV
jgi:hypothetical protein